MTSSSIAKSRRAEMAKYMRHGIMSPTKLHTALKDKFEDCTIHQIKHDIKWFKEHESDAWLNNLGEHGFTFLARNIDEQLEEMVEDIQTRITQGQANEIKIRLSCYKAIAELNAHRFQIALNGPTLMKIRRNLAKHDHLIQN